MSEYRPIAVPSLGGSASSVSQTAFGFGQGFSRIGEGLTNLGKRRQARQDEARAEQERLDLEEFKQKAALAGSPEQLMNMLSGDAPVGAADFAFGRQTDMLNQESGRINNDISRETLRSNRTANDGLDLEYQGQKAKSDFDAEYGQDLIEAFDLVQQGKVSEAQAALSAIGETASGKYGASVVEDAFARFDARRAKGEELRNTEASNLIGLDQDRATLNQTRANTQISLGDRSDRGAANALNLSEGQNAFDRLLAEQAENDTVRGGYAKYMDTATSRESALANVDADATLSPEERMRIQNEISAAFKANPDILDTINPIDRFAEPDTIYSAEDGELASQGGPGRTFQSVRTPTGVVNVPVTSPNQQNVGVVNAGIQRGIKTFMEGNTSQSIFREAELLSTAEGGAPNLTQFVANKYPELEITENQRGQLINAARELNLTPGEVLAIADRSIKRRGKSWSAVFTDDKMSDVVFSVSEFKKIGKAYKSQNSALLAEQQELLNQFSAQAENIRSKISRVRAERDRAIQAKDVRTKELLDTQITDMNYELKGIQASVDKMNSSNNTRSGQLVLNGNAQ